MSRRDRFSGGGRRGRLLPELLQAGPGEVAFQGCFRIDCHAGGERVFGLVVAAGQQERPADPVVGGGVRQSREVMEKVRQHFQALKVWNEWHGYGYYRDTSFRQMEVRLPGGVRVIGLPANPMTARGFTGDVFLDEFAMHADDVAIWSALFPTLLRGAGELDVSSTRAHWRDNQAFLESAFEADATGGSVHRAYLGRVWRARP